MKHTKGHSCESDDDEYQRISTSKKRVVDRPLSDGKDNGKMPLFLCVSSHLLPVIELCPLPIYPKMMYWQVCVENKYTPDAPFLDYTPILPDQQSSKCTQTLRHILDISDNKGTFRSRVVRDSVLIEAGEREAFAMMREVGLSVWRCSAVIAAYEENSGELLDSFDAFDDADKECSMMIDAISRSTRARNAPNSCNDHFYCNPKDCADCSDDERNLKNQISAIQATVLKSIAHKCSQCKDSPLRLLTAFVEEEWRIKTGRVPLGVSSFAHSLCSVAVGAGDNVLGGHSDGRKSQLLRGSIKRLLALAKAKEQQNCTGHSWRRPCALSGANCIFWTPAQQELFENACLALFGDRSHRNFVGTADGFDCCDVAMIVGSKSCRQVEMHCEFLLAQPSDYHCDLVGGEREDLWKPGDCVDVCRIDKRQCACVVGGRECRLDLCGCPCNRPSTGNDQNNEKTGRNNQQLSKYPQRIREHNSKTIIAPSPISGWGLFAAAAAVDGSCEAGGSIEAHALIHEYCGELISEGEMLRRGQWYDLINSNYLFQFTQTHAAGQKKKRFIDSPCDDDYDDARINSSDDASKWSLDAYSMGTPARFCNHSQYTSDRAAGNACNAYARIVRVLGTPRIGIFARRRIVGGEEICFDYGPIYSAHFE